MGDIFIVDFSNYKKFESPVIRLVRAGQVFDVQAKPKWIFSKNNNIYVSKDDGAIHKLEEKTSTEKNLIAYEKISNNPKFISNLPKMEVHCISLHLTGNSILISSENSQLFMVDIASDNALFDGNNYKPFLYPYHSEEINCLDVAKVKPLVATCSRDRSIRIWNYINHQLETSEIFEDEPTSLSFHPNGLHLAVAFVTKYKLLHILEKQIMAYKEINLFNLITDVNLINSR
jgi:WD40 repeat protein